MTAAESDEVGQADTARGGGTAPRDVPPPRQSRKLADKVLTAFHQACDQSEFEVARKLLDIYEFMTLRRDLPVDAGRRRAMDALVAAHERLWNLRHPGQV